MTKQQDRLKILRTKRSNKIRECKHTKALPEGVKARGLLWVRLNEKDKTRTYRCQECLYELIGFIPNEARLLRKERKCAVCGRVTRVIGFKAPLPLPEGKKSFVCIECFKNVGVD